MCFDSCEDNGEMAAGSLGKVVVSDRSAAQGNGVPLLLLPTRLDLLPYARSSAYDLAYAAGLGRTSS